MDHQYLGLADIQRIAGVGALFDTLVVFENYPVDPTAAGRRRRRTAASRTSTAATPRTTR